MTEDRDEKTKLREEVNLLREQLLRISERLEESAEEAEEAQEEARDEVEEALEEAEEEIEEALEEAEEEVEESEEDRDEDWDRFDDSYYRRRRPRSKVKYHGGADFGDQLGDYLGDFIEDVMEGVSGEIERSLFWDRRSKRERPTMMSDSEVARTVAVMSALGNEHRLKILRELTWGGLYTSDFQDALKEISASTLSSHLDVLQQAGLIVQERRRGRYLITMSGRLAIRMASSIAKSVKVDIKPGGFD
ncbi:winged helix-turn-helix transcriptional regulator [Candidatus Bathyarchaeota archaeon]|nr:winged helix-turn-helix transcriptional regulator [Candidatus Bathyarchaeota archaeon]